MDASSIRALVLANPRTSDGYAPHVRDGVARYAQGRRLRGRTWAEISGDVGISSTAIRTWMDAEEFGGFEQVEIVEARTTSTSHAVLALTSPSGFVLTGFTLEQAAGILRVLR